jgi:hypothetical protein
LICGRSTSDPVHFTAASARSHKPFHTISEALLLLSGMAKIPESAK